MFSRKQVKIVYDFVSTLKTLPSLAEFERKFCRDTSEYEGKVLLRCSYSIRQTRWSEDILLDKIQYDFLTSIDSIYLSEVFGKHSEVFLSFHEVEDECITDPDEIATFLDSNGYDEYGILANIFIDDHDYCFTKFVKTKEAKKEKKKKERIQSCTGARIVLSDNGSVIWSGYDSAYQTYQRSLKEVYQTQLAKDATYANPKEVVKRGASVFFNQPHCVKMTNIECQDVLMLLKWLDGDMVRKALWHKQATECRPLKGQHNLFVKGLEYAVKNNKSVIFTKFNLVHRHPSKRRKSSDFV